MRRGWFVGVPLVLATMAGCQSEPQVTHPVPTPPVRVEPPAIPMPFVGYPGPVGPLDAGAPAKAQAQAQAPTVPLADGGLQPPSTAMPPDRPVYRVP